MDKKATSQHSHEDRRQKIEYTGDHKNYQDVINDDCRSEDYSHSKKFTYICIAEYYS